MVRLVAHAIRRACLVTVLIFLSISSGLSQSDPDQIGPVLQEEIIAPAVAGFQLRQYLLDRVAKPPRVTDAVRWTAESKRLRQHLLNDIVFHGWPSDWVTAPPKFEDVGEVEGGIGYRMRKLRYEIVPGFQSTAILYEPLNIEGRIPAVLNVNGHVGPLGKAVEYKQKRCINFAKHGILALNLEWLGFGELSQFENQHWFGAHLDLVGSNELGLFYLAMRRGLDYLSNHPSVDPDRLGVTGLSGGGWQTIVLSALDERVSVAVPVAGYSSVATRVEVKKYGDLGDIEQSATDFLAGQDFTHLTAMRAPRPTLEIYNAEDDCCFRAPLVKPAIFDAIRPFFKLYGKDDSFEWHENTDPSTHNYQLDNRLHAYRFFSKQFHLPPIESETPAGSEVKSYDELAAGLPKENLTILGLARKMAKQIARQPIPSDSEAKAEWTAAEAQKLRTVLRYKPVRVVSSWAVANTKNKGLETKSYLFQMDNGLSVNAVWLKAIQAPENAPATVVLNDQGKKAAAAEVSDRVNRGEQVMAVDLLFTGPAWTQPEPYEYAQILHGLGQRALGLTVAQLIEIGRWFRSHAGVPKVRLESTGFRNQVAALAAPVLERNLFSEVVIHEGMRSLGYLLEKPVEFRQAPELFCLDLYKEFDLDRMIAAAGPTTVTVERYVEAASK